MHSRTLRVTSLAGPFRRAGHNFGREPVELELGTLTGAQLVLLTNEPALRVEALDEDGSAFPLPKMGEEQARAFDEAMAVRPEPGAETDVGAAQAQVDARETSPTAEQVDEEIGGGATDAASEQLHDGGDQGTGDGPNASAADVSEVIDPAASEEQRAGTNPADPPKPPARGGKAKA